MEGNISIWVDREKIIKFTKHSVNTGLLILKENLNHFSPVDSRDQNLDICLRTSDLFIWDGAQSFVNVIKQYRTQFGVKIFAMQVP